MEVVESAQQWMNHLYPAPSIQGLGNTVAEGAVNGKQSCEMLALADVNWQSLWLLAQSLYKSKPVNISSLDGGPRAHPWQSCYWQLIDPEGRVTLLRGHGFCRVPTLPVDGSKPVHIWAALVKSQKIINNIIKRGHGVGWGHSKWSWREVAVEGYDQSISYK